ncbi:MAG: NAD-dependent deacylase [Flavobacteriaceae bacterium]|nr:NAD-dependent deacylase [Candidatus Onthonaster equi]
MKKIVVLTGAGISAESGISTFRDANGLWENHDIMEVASIQGWNVNPALVLDFYNLRRAQLKEVYPNAAHYFLAELEKKFKVSIITQNVDDLHERAGSSTIIHLHGELNKVRGIANENLIYDWMDDLKLGDLAEDGMQLRPHIVWFGEEVPMMCSAINEMKEADILLIIGTSLQVYPAASLLDYIDYETKVICIDPNDLPINSNIYHIKKNATEGIVDLENYL